MKVNKHGDGVLVSLSGDDVARAIITYLTAHRIYIDGPMTIRVNDQLCESGTVYVDPAGAVIEKGFRITGNDWKNKRGAE